MNQPVNTRTDEDRRRAAEAIAAGASRSDAARLIGAARSTVSKWVNQDEGFQALVESLKVEAETEPGLLEELRGQIETMTDAELGDAALTSLAEIALNGITAAPVRVSAAKAILEHVERNPQGEKTSTSARDLLGSATYDEIVRQIRQAHRDNP